ncbi:transketolase [Christensenella tenuis]|uniref:Transketolase N-terminal domain-containing protein n=1 Tax=Christensenella tenuis TaxID=2763033 RepID=A0ABR7EHY4_9FIRM|nr:thiamine pyrophosphate-dependent enzyme [Christensenella tenuis]MBC5649376.1 hypothetical protein [Christensenella tenuis]
MAKIRIDNVRDLVLKANEIRSHLIDELHRIGGIHIGGALSSVNMAVALYYKYMEFDPEELLSDPARNQFLLSKGHAGILLYAIYCDMGIYTYEFLETKYNTIGNPFGGHPNRHYTKGVEASTGSLGHGLSWACGWAIANKMNGINSRQYIIMGDGEQEEGQIWEAALSAGSKKLDSIVGIVDFNHFSAAWETGENVKWGEKGGAEGLADCYRAFGWNAVVIDGTKMAEIDKALSELPPVTYEGKPNVIIMNTTKGEGVGYMMENGAAWHIGGVDAELYVKTKKEIEEYNAKRLQEVE